MTNRSNIKFLLLAVACCCLPLLFTGCADSGVKYRPAAQKLPPHIKRIAVRPFANKTPQFGLEDKLTLRVIDEFLKNGEYGTVPEASADGIVIGEITRYILTPVQYDANLVPTIYKLDILLSVKFLDKAYNTFLWHEPALQGIQNYSASTLPGGMTEEQAREAVWNILSRDIVKRTVEGFGSVTSASQRRISPTEPEVSTGTPRGPAPQVPEGVTHPEGVGP